MKTRNLGLESQLGIDAAKLRVALGYRNLHLYDIAHRPPLAVAPSTLSGWLSGRRRAPADLRQRLEQAIGLPEGWLQPTGGA